MPTARSAPKYQLTRQRQEPVLVARIDAPEPSTTAAGRGVNDGRQGLFIVVDRAESTVAPGGDAVFAVRVRNTGSLVERVTVGTVDLPAAWVSVEPPDMKLDVSGEAVATVHIRPPRDASVRPGTSVFMLSAWSTTNPNVRCQEPCRLTVTEFGDSRLVVAQPNATGKGRGSFAVSLINQGNLPVRGRLVSNGETARVELEPSSVDAAPGTTTEITARVVPKARLITGSPTNHVITLAVDGSPGVMPVVFSFLQRPRLSRLAAKVLTVVGLVLLVAAGLVVRSAWANRPRPVPQVVGKVQAEAEQSLQSKGFTVVVREVVDAQPAGTVISQDPKSGTERAKGAKVTIGVSSGPAPIAVPNLSGFTQDQAKAELTSQGFALVVDDPVPDDVVPLGQVSSQDPKPGTVLAVGSPVHVSLSSGPTMVKVPSLIGLTADAANGQLSGQGLVFAVGEYVRDDQLAGTVVKQSTPAGTPVVKGTLVTVTVAISTTAVMPPTTGG